MLLSANGSGDRILSPGIRVRLPIGVQIWACMYQGWRCSLARNVWRVRFSSGPQRYRTKVSIKADYTCVVYRGYWFDSDRGLRNITGSTLMVFFQAAWSGARGMQVRILSSRQGIDKMSRLDCRESLYSKVL